MESGIQNRIVKSGIQPLMKSGVRGCRIRNTQTQTWNPESTAWNPESKTLLDYITWGETTVTALLEATNNWAFNIDKDSVNAVVFLDLKKGFRYR